MAIDKKDMSIGELLLKQKKQIEAALPKHMTADRMLRVVMTEIRKIPDLAKCTAKSLISSVIQCSQLGLEPGLLGHAYLIPYNRKVKNDDGSWSTIKECQLIIGYRGMLDLARRSGQLLSVSVHEVYSGDKFEYAYGIEEKCVHIPSGGNRGDFIGAYGVVRLKDGGYTWGYMPKNEIEKIRASSKSKDNGPWVTNYDEMAKKTVIRRLFKYLPISIEMQHAVALDEAADRGESFVIDGEVDSAQSGALEHQEANNEINNLNTKQSKAEEVGNLM